MEMQRWEDAQATVHLVARVSLGDPITRTAAYQNLLAIGTAFGSVSLWDMRTHTGPPVLTQDCSRATLPPPCGVKLADLRQRSVEAVKGLAIVRHPLHANDHKVGLALYATIGDRYCVGWELRELDSAQQTFLVENERIVELDRPHSTLGCQLASVVQSAHLTLISTQGQAHSHLINIATGLQSELGAIGCASQAHVLAFDGARLVVQHAVPTRRQRRLDVVDVRTGALLRSVTTPVGEPIALDADTLVCADSRTTTTYSITDGRRLWQQRSAHGAVAAVLVRGEFTVTLSLAHRLCLWLGEACVQELALPSALFTCYSVSMAQLGWAPSSRSDGDTVAFVVTVSTAEIVLWVDFAYS